MVFLTVMGWISILRLPYDQIRGGVGGREERTGREDKTRDIIDRQELGLPFRVDWLGVSMNNNGWSWQNSWRATNIPCHGRK